METNTDLLTSAGFIRPLRAAGAYVLDKRSRMVCECNLPQTAKALVAYVAQLEQENARLKAELAETGSDKGSDKGSAQG